MLGKYSTVELHPSSFIILPYKPTFLLDDHSQNLRFWKFCSSEGCLCIYYGNDDYLRMLVRIYFL
jgi:hypothetical protein